MFCPYFSLSDSFFRYVPPQLRNNHSSGRPSHNTGSPNASNPSNNQNLQNSSRNEQYGQQHRRDHRVEHRDNHRGGGHMHHTDMHRTDHREMRGEQKDSTHRHEKNTSTYQKDANRGIVALLRTIRG